MSESTVSLVLGLVGLIGGLGAGAFGLWSASLSGSASVRAASEAAGGPIHDSGSARNAQFQNQRRTEYAALLEALTDDKLSAEVPRRTAKALLVVREEGLRKELESLLEHPSEVQGKKLSQLAWEMNLDAGK